MTRSEVAHEINLSIINVTDCDLIAVGHEKNKLKDIGLDSLDNVELIVDLEKKFDVCIEDDEFEAIERLGELYDFIFNKIINK